MAINADMLKKTASLLRKQEQEKVAVLKDLSDMKKEAEAGKAVINMLKEGLIDVDDIDAKLAEFRADPEFLKKTNSFFEKTSGVGEIKDADAPTQGNAENSFWSMLQGG